MSADNLNRMQTVHYNAYNDKKVVWCKETIRYLLGQLDNQGLIDCGLTGVRVAVSKSLQIMNQSIHFLIAHMCCVDSALPGNQDGTKKLNLLAPAGKHK